MKKIISWLFILTSLLFFSSCQKTTHYVRLYDGYSLEVFNVVAGNAQIGNVNAGATSDYQLIDSGNFSISGHTANGQQLTGSGYTKGSGTHYWTITLDASGKASIALDR